MATCCDPCCLLGESESTGGGHVPALQLRAGAAAPGPAPNPPPSLQDTRTPACSPSPGLPGAARHSSGTGATPHLGGLALGRGSLPTKATGAEPVHTESEPHLRRVQSHG